MFWSVRSTSIFFRIIHLPCLLLKNIKIFTNHYYKLFCCVSKLYGDQARFFDAEKAPRIKHRKKGTVSMVNNGNEQHGSQVILYLFFSSSCYEVNTCMPSDTRVIYI